MNSYVVQVLFIRPFRPYYGSRAIGMRIVSILLPLCFYGPLASTCSFLLVSYQQFGEINR